MITGTSRGIGAATARAFGRAGATAVLAARDEGALVAVADEIHRDGGRAVVVPTHVAEASAVERLVEATLNQCGRLDYAFNNAADGHRLTPLAEVPIEAFDSALAVTLRSMFLSMKYEIRAMLKTGGGAIVKRWRPWCSGCAPMPPGSSTVRLSRLTAAGWPGGLGQRCAWPLRWRGESQAAI